MQLGPLLHRHLLLKQFFYRLGKIPACKADGIPLLSAAQYSRTSLYSMSYANSMYSMNNIVHTASLDLNSKISDHLSNQFLATFSKLDDVRGSNSDEFPFIDIQDGSGDNVQYMSLGYELFTWNNAVHNNVLNIKDDLTYYTGNHKITGG